MSNKVASTWKRSSGFAWAMIGSAVGFANILSFSAQCYKNGGGAFLIPFIAAILLLGLPMLFLEGTIGHRMRLPIVSAFGKQAGSIGRLFGWLSVMAVATIGTFYIVLTGYSVAYAYFTGVLAIPSDTAGFFHETFLRQTGSLAEFGALSWPVLIGTMAVCGLSWVVLTRQIRSGVERICSVFLPMLFVLMIVFAVAALFLPGAMEGVRQYLIPDFAKLKDPALWRDVFGQVFFSFSLGLGIVTGYARYTQQTTSIPRVMVYVALGDFLISAIAGLAIFCCVGYLSHTTGTPFAEIVSSDSSFEMGFVIFPKILQAFGPFGLPLGVLFFFCVFIAGITGVFSIMESIMGNLQVEFSRSRKAAATITTVVLAGGAVLFCFGNGQALIGALAPMVLGNNYLIGGLAEVVIFMYMTKAIQNDPIWIVGERRRLGYHLLRWAIPAILGLILITSIWQELASGVGVAEAVRWGWLGAAIVVASLLSRRRTPVASLRAI